MIFTVLLSSCTDDASTGNTRAMLCSELHDDYLAVYGRTPETSCATELLPCTDAELTTVTTRMDCIMEGIEASPDAGPSIADCGVEESAISTACSEASASFLPPANGDGCASPPECAFLCLWDWGDVGDAACAAL